MRYWLSNGTPAEKLILGLATYGRSFALSSENNHVLGAPAKGPGQAGTYTGEAGFLSYYEVINCFNCMGHCKISRMVKDSLIILYTHS